MFLFKLDFFLSLFAEYFRLLSRHLIGLSSVIDIVFCLMYSWIVPGSTAKSYDVFLLVIDDCMTYPITLLFDEPFVWVPRFEC